VSRLVSEKLQAALHPQRVLVFYRRDSRGDFTLGHSSGGIEPELRISGDDGVLRILEESSGPRDFPFSDSAAGLTACEREYLERLGVCLLAPVRGTERTLVGILMLGEKRSESPYTRTDRELLQTIAGQIGVVYENIALRESARREAQIKRDVLARLDGGEINLLKECPRCGACFDGAAATCAMDGAELTLTLPVDRTIEGVYRLEQRIGSGAMGAVYRATDLRLGRMVALKLMVGSLFGNRAALRRFEREARAAARLNHPNIVAIHDFGALPSDGAYLVMELLDGRTMRAELRGCRRFAPVVAADRFEQLTEGLSAAHAAGVVHRDLKPENLIVAHMSGGGELVKILDFGLAKVTRAEVPDHASLTMPGAVVGTLGYMSPEQLLGYEVDERTDTFAVGVMAVECLTGARPFAGASLQDLLQSTLHQRAEIPGDSGPVRRLNSVLGRCLEKERDARPRVVDIRGELVEAIRACPAIEGMEFAGREVSTIDATRSF
jgi:serine/threonine protein kinase